MSIALTRNQYALECGGVLLDPSTNEVCLLFYPDTSEWRLPIGRPAMAVQDSGYQPFEASVAGCEPPAHSAQRLITQITGYRCTHVHPSLAESLDACAYVGPQMVEPLALQIQQRTTGSLADPLEEPDDANHQPRMSPACQYVLTSYYMAWLTQSRFEQRAATQPVGPAMEPSIGGEKTAGGLPLAEVTWFKMDTAAQVLSHESDKLALREAIHRLTRCDVPRAPFTYSSALLKEPPAVVEPVPAEESVPSVVSVESVSDGAARTVCVTPARVVSQSGSRNLDLLRKTATSLSKRGGLLIRSARNQGKDEDLPAVAVAQSPPTPHELVVRANKPHIPRVLSIFYKLVGSSTH